MQVQKSRKPWRAVPLAAALVVAAAATALPGPARAVVVNYDFQALADGNEGDWASRTTTGTLGSASWGDVGGKNALQIGNIQVVAEGFAIPVTGGPANPVSAYLDGFYRLDSNHAGGVGGLGVCKVLSGTQCNPSSDDNVTSDEMLKLSFFDLADNPIDVTILNSKFLDTDHETAFPTEIGAPPSVIDITADPLVGPTTAGTWALAGMVSYGAGLTGQTFYFDYNNSQFYLAAISVNKVPEPGTLALFAFGLAGLGLARRRRLRV